MISVSFIIYAFYVPIVFLIYTAQVVIVIVNKRKPQFRSSYFSLFIIEALTGLATTIAITIVYRLVLLPEMNSLYADFPSNALTTGLYFSGYYFPSCQEYINIFIALNRLSALVWYQNYDRVWTRVGWLCLPIIFGFPFISFYHLIDVNTEVYTTNNATTWFFDYDHKVRPWRSNRVELFYLYTICSVISLLLNLSCIVVIRFSSMEKVSSIEIRLFLLGFLSFACGLPMTIQQFLYFYIKSTSFDDLNAMSLRLPWLYDLKALSPGILSVIFSTAIRNELRRGLTRGRATQVSSFS